MDERELEARREFVLKEPFFWGDFSKSGTRLLEENLRIYFPEYELMKDTELIFGSGSDTNEWLTQLKTGKIKTVLRYWKNTIVIPPPAEIPFGKAKTTIPFKCDDDSVYLVTGSVTVDRIAVKTIDMITNEDIFLLGLGYRNKRELSFALWSYYGEIWPNAIITLYNITDFKINSEGNGAA